MKEVSAMAKNKKSKMPHLPVQNNTVYIQRDKGNEQMNFVNKPLSPRIKKMLNLTNNHDRKGFSSNRNNSRQHANPRVELKAIRDRFKIRLNKRETNLILSRKLSPTIIKNNVTIHNLIYNQVNSSKPREGKRRNLKISVKRDSKKRFFSPQFSPINKQFIANNTPTNQTAESPGITPKEVILKEISTKPFAKTKLKIIPESNRKKWNRDVKSIDKIKSHELSTTAEETSESKKMKDIHIEVGLPEASVNENLQTVETNDCAESSHTIDQHAISSHHGNNSNHAHNPNHAENKEVHLEVPEMVCYRKFHPVPKKREFKRPKKLFTLRDIKKLTQTHLGRYVEEKPKNSSFSDADESNFYILNQISHDALELKCLSKTECHNDDKKEEKRKKYSDFFEKLNMYHPELEMENKTIELDQSLSSCMQNINKSVNSSDEEP